ncbi:zf-CHY-domain-containing protein [Xylariaceae sp. AK1471]|nr:zf-CHY-domain-containing protein [Xylariaceae sp. AK1471]
MTSLVTEFLVSPILRQARRFSISRSSLVSNPPDPDSLLRIANTCPNSQQDDVMSETEEDSYLRDDPGDSASQLSSQSSVLLNSHVEDCNQPDNNATNSTNSIPSVDSRELEPQSGLSSAIHPNMSTSGSLSSPLVQSILQDRSPLPEDDGMSSLRKRIYAIQAQDIGHSQKAHLMHQLLIEGYTNSQTHIQTERPFTPLSPRSFENRLSQGHGPLESFKFWQNALGEAGNAEECTLTDEDLEPTFVPTKQPTGSAVDAADTDSHDERLLGCEHYRRNVKLQCSTCNRWYTCRFCHDKAEDHNLIRKETRNMLCMFCGTAQKASQACVSCEAPAARYYCDICKLWNDDPDKPCYHCNDCGICRIGRGIGKDFYHCKKCSACIAIATQSDHRCIERATDCDCPICGEYLFTSPTPVCFMKCGHSIHRDCFGEHMKTSYKCPICNKSLVNMESQFRNLDLSIQAQPMPPEFRDTRAMVLCHDCSAKSSTMYHWLGLKCGVCQSYNTAQLQIIGLDPEAIETDIVARSAQVLGLIPPVNTDAAVMDAAVRDMRRRHSSTVMGPACAGADLSSLPPDRLGRSVSPSLTPGRSLDASRVGGYFDLEDDEEDGDIIGFWSRVPRSITSNDDDDDAAEASDDMTSDEELEDDEGEESEDDDFELLGHR